LWLCRQIEVWMLFCMGADLWLRYVLCGILFSVTIFISLFTAVAHFMLVVIGHVCTEAQEFTRVVVLKSSELCSQIVLVQRARGE
jgi:hypothetical protein